MKPHVEQVKIPTVEKPKMTASAYQKAVERLDSNEERVGIPVFIPYDSTEV